MKRSIRGMGLFQRLILYFSIIITSSLTLVSYLIYEHSTKQMIEQAESHLSQVVNYTLVQTDRFIRNYELVSLSLITNNNVRRMLDIPEKDIFDLSDYTEIKHIINQMYLQHNEIELIYLMGDNQKQVMTDVVPYTGDILFQKIYQEASETAPDTGKAVIRISPSLTSEGQYVLNISRKIRGRTGYDPKGVLRIDVRISALEELWDIANLNHNKFFIVDEQGFIIYHPDRGQIGLAAEASIMEELEHSNQGTFLKSVNDTPMLFHYLTSDYTNWKIVATTPQELILEPISGIKRTAITIGAVTLAFALILALIFTRNIVRPLKHVQKGMRRMEHEYWRKITYTSSINEINDLIMSYNMLVERLSTTITELYQSELRNKQSELERKQVELQALQYQINPHFLHNTLETINSLAIMQEADDISDMTEAISAMFRYSVRNMEIVTIQDELDHLSRYLFIQEQRFQRQIPIDIHIPECLLHKQIVKLSLQPLVENAVQHGIKKMPDGKIVISAYEQDKFLYLTVWDNGVGMSEDKVTALREVLAKKPELQTEHATVRSTIQVNKPFGIGILNVHRRITIVFGDEYGIEIESKLNDSTTMIMKLPTDDQLMNRQS